MRSADERSTRAAAEAGGERRADPATGRAAADPRVPRLPQERRGLDHPLLASGQVRAARVVLVDEDHTDAAPDLVPEAGLAEDVTGDEVEVRLSHLREAVEVDRVDAPPDLLVRGVVEQDHGPPDRRRVEEVLDVPANARSRVVAVDQDEVDV